VRCRENDQKPFAVRVQIPPAPDFLKKHRYMKANLYNELITLTVEGSPIQNPEGAAQSIRTAKIAGAPEKMRKEMRDMTARFILPAVPEGMQFARSTFWDKFVQKFVWNRAWTGTDEQKERAAEWLQRERTVAQNRGRTWPPNPTFRPVVAVPQPWDGKEEKPGRIPRTGKD
jgi:hypothetical protein